MFKMAVVRELQLMCPTLFKRNNVNLSKAGKAV